MVTDRYLTVMHHPTIQDFADYCKEQNLPIIGIDNVPGSKQLEPAVLPESCVLLFGQEGAGMSDEGIAVCEVLYEINQYGSTRSMNAFAVRTIDPIFRSCCQFSIAICSLWRFVFKSLTIASTVQ